MRLSATWGVLAGCLAAGQAGAAASAEPDGGTPAAIERAFDGGSSPGPVTVALLTFESNKAAAEASAAVNALVASRLAESKKLRVVSDKDVAAALGRERQKQLLGGCSDTACMTELSGALGARYVVAGRLDRLGGRYLLTATLFDSQRTLSVAKPRAEAANDDGLAQAVDLVTAELLERLGSPRASPVGATAAGGFSLGLKLGNQFLASLAALNPGAEAEFGWAFDPEWTAFLQVGFNLVRGESAGKEVRLTVVPGVLGVRKAYRAPSRLQPYWGLGMGLQLSFGKFGPISETDSFPTFIGMSGCQYWATDHLAVLAEVSVNLAQLVLGLRSKDFGLGAGLNVDLSLGVLYRF